MLSEIEIDGWKVEVDKEKTCKAYQMLKANKQFGVDCSCYLCKNVNANLKQKFFPQFLIDTCYQFGIDYTIPGEFYVYSDTEATALKTLDYHGFYSFYGKILAKPELIKIRY